MLRAKRPMTLLAGPFGHPAHAAVVTVPVGAWVASFVFDVASRWAGDPATFTVGAYWLIVLGLVGALTAAFPGFLDLFGIPPGTRAFRTGLVHMGLNLAVVGLFAVSLALRRGDIDTPSAAGGTSIGLLALSAGALAVLGVAGWLGGRLSFRFGVRVADEAAQSEGFLQRKDTN